MPSRMTNWSRFSFRTNFRGYILVLCVMYMFLVMMFHVNLNSDDLHHSRQNYLNSRNRLAQQSISQLEKDVYLAHKVNRTGLIETNNINLGQSDSSRNNVLSQRSLHKWEGEPAKGSEYNKTCIGKPTEESFQFVEISPHFFVYSVFWDARPNDFDNKDGAVFLRIMTVISQGIARQKRPLYCLFADSDRNVGMEGDGQQMNQTKDMNGNTTYTAVLATYYEMCENHGKSYGGHILSCRLPEAFYDPVRKTPLCSVRLSPSTAKEGRDFHIVDTKPRPNPHSFSICTAPLYGNIPKIKLVEFMELSAMLGAEHITFYDFDISQDTQMLLRYYQKHLRASLIPWGLPPAVEAGIWYHGQLIAILDCLYRNMASTRYLAFNDIDEFMVPYNYSDWADMMTHIDKEEHCGYQFNSAFFDPGRGQRLKDPTGSALVTFTSNHKTVQSSHIRTKCMVKPYMLFEAGIHHISKPILAHLQTIRLDLPGALLHHYRSCQANFRMNCQEFEHSTMIQDKYGKLLVENVYKSLDKIDTYISSSLNI